MSNNRMRFEGLADLREDLRRLPKELRDEGGTIVEDSANEGAAEARKGYEKHRHSGNLEKGVVVQVLTRSDRIAAAIVKSTAPHAFIFENGTEARYTKHGDFRGQMKAGNVFVPAIIRARHQMYDRLRNLLRGKGLKVSG